MIFFEHDLFNDEDEEVNQTLVDWQVYSLITSPILTKEKEKVAESVESLHSRLAARLVRISLALSFAVDKGGWCAKKGERGQ